MVLTKFINLYRGNYEKRLQVAAEVMSHAGNYDYVVINDNFEKAVKEIQKIIKAEHLKRLNNETK